MMSIILYKKISIRDRNWIISSARQQSIIATSKQIRNGQAMKPMVLSLEYWEQTGNALENLFNLQCWASSVNITEVVEPSISTRINVFYFHGKRYHPNLTFQDLFDISHWNQISLTLNRSILVSRNNFLRHASKNVIHVQIRYKQLHSWFRCKSLADLAKQDWFKLLESNGFSISTVCVEVLEPIAADVFMNKIYGATHSSMQNVTIIFETWRGFGNTRLLLSGLKCKRGYLISRLLISTCPAKIKYPPPSLSSPFAPLVLSKKVLLYLNTFVSQYMHGMQYVAVMFRSEKLVQSIISSSPQRSSCMEGILSDHKKALDHINGTKTLLFTDSGNHGSRSLYRTKAAEKFFQYLQKNLELELSIALLDSAFENITQSKDSVLIALLQSVVVARATCVVMVGGGTFQKMTLGMYAHSHKGHECYFFRNSECISMYLNS